MTFLILHLDKFLSEESKSPEFKFLFFELKRIRSEADPLIIELIEDDPFNGSIDGRYYLMNE